jgi:hypothetical protein
VSRPGQNVLNDNLPAKQVAFDTRWIGACRVFASGVINVGDGSTATVMFGTTLSEPPAVLALRRNTEGTIQERFYPLGDSSSGRTVVGGPAAGPVNAGLRPDTNPIMDVRADRVIFRNEGTLNMRVYYIILMI